MFLTNAEDLTFSPKSWLEIPICGKTVVKFNPPKRDIMYLTTVGCLNLDQCCGSHSALSLNPVQRCLIFYWYICFLPFHYQTSFSKRERNIFPSFLLTFPVNHHLRDNSPDFTDSTILGLLCYIHFKTTIPLEEEAELVE